MQPGAGPGVTPASGELLNDRFRLGQIRSQRSLADGSEVTLWQGVDEVLDRHCAVLFVSCADRERHRALLAAASAASAVSDARCIRILDVGSPPLGRARRPAGPLWIATEWVDAPTLADVVRREPLAPRAAVELVQQCAQALAAAARTGCRHGRLRPDQILLPAREGLPRIAGVGIAAALDDAPATDSADVRALGAVLYAAATGRWPAAGWNGLPAAAPDGGPVPRLRRVLPAAPRELDELIARLLAGALPDAAAVSAALAALPTETVDEAREAARRRRRAVATRWAWRVVPPGLVAVVGLAGWLVGSDLGRVPGAARHRPVPLPASTAAAPGSHRAVALVWQTPPAVSSFDPEGDGQENEDQADLAVDRDSSTSWTTSTYRGSAHFGGLKDGVGLLLDLGAPKRVSLAELSLSTPGCDVELRAGDTPPRQASDLTLAATTSSAPAQVRWALHTPVTARYWLVWFTGLTHVPGGYGAGVAEIALLG